MPKVSAEKYKIYTGFLKFHPFGGHYIDALSVHTLPSVINFLNQFSLCLFGTLNFIETCAAEQKYIRWENSTKRKTSFHPRVFSFIFYNTESRVMANYFFFPLFLRGKNRQIICKFLILFSAANFRKFLEEEKKKRCRYTFFIRSHAYVQLNCYCLLAPPPFIRAQEKWIIN